MSLTFWNDVKVRAWADDSRMLALYLLTCPHRTLEGIYHLPLELAASDVGWPVDRLRHALAELLATDFVDVDETARLVLIVKGLKYQPTIRGPRSLQGAINALEGTNGSDRLFGRFMQAADNYQPELAAHIRGHYGLQATAYRSPS